MPSVWHWPGSSSLYAPYDPDHLFTCNIHTTTFLAVLAPGRPQIRKKFVLGRLRPRPISCPGRSRPAHDSVKLSVVARESNFHNWINVLIRNVIDCQSFVFFHKNINRLAKFLIHRIVCFYYIKNCDKNCFYQKLKIFIFQQIFWDF